MRGEDTIIFFMKLHHIGIACKNIEEQKEKLMTYHDIKETSEIVFDEEQESQLCLLTLEDGSRLELISGKPVEKFVEKGISYCHVCYEVSDLNKKMIEFQNEGGIIVSHPKPAKLFNMRQVAFIYLSYGLIELLEE